MRGPIDYVIVGFEGNKFDGSILPAIGDAIDKGIINLIAFSFIEKDADGTVNSVDLADLGDDEYVVDFVQKYPGDDTVIDDDDIDEISDLVEPNTSVGMLVVEHVWAVPLKQAIVKANGVLIADGRIHPDAADELDSESDD